MNDLIAIMHQPYNRVHKARITEIRGPHDYQYRELAWTLCNSRITHWINYRPHMKDSYMHVQFCPQCFPNGVD